MSAKPAEKPDRFNTFLTIICLVLVVLVLLLVRQNLSLKSQIAEHAHEGPPVERFEAGDEFGSLVLIDDAGATEAYDFGETGGKTLVLVFTPDCPACQRTVPVWTELLSEQSFPGVDVVGVQLDRGPDSEIEPLPWPALPFDVFGIDYDGSTATRKLSAVPGTFLVDATGVVELSWYGVLTDEQEADLLESLTRG
jgi:thiol-disulfide isomerase/thioredoxin